MNTLSTIKVISRNLTLPVMLLGIIVGIFLSVSWFWIGIFGVCCLFLTSIIQCIDEWNFSVTSDKDEEVDIDKLFDESFCMDTDNGTGPAFLFRINSDGSRSIAHADDVKIFIAETCLDD